MDFLIEFILSSKWYLIAVKVLTVLSFFLYWTLPRQERRLKFFKYPLGIMVLVFFYEHLGSLTNSNREWNGFVYDYFYPNYTRNLYNVWVYNIFSNQLGSILFLLLIRNLIQNPLLKRIIAGLILSITGVALILELSGVLPIINNQPTIFFLFYGGIIISCGLFFMDLLTNPKLIEVDILREFSFWQVTLILFYYSMVFLIQIAFNYLWATQPELLNAMFTILRFMFTLIMITFTLTLGHSLIFKKSSFAISYD